MISTLPQIRPRVLLFSSLFPSSVRPGHGIFVATRLRELLAGNVVDARVVAPVPWFYSTDLRHGEYALMARTPERETLDGIDTFHPRYLLPPRVGMNVAPFAMAAAAAGTLRRVIREGFDFDVIDAHYYYPDGVAAALLARHFDKPLVVTARGSDVNLIANYAIPRRLMRWAARQADTSVAVSEALADKMAAMGMPGDRIQVLRNGVDLARFSPLPRAESRATLGWREAPTLIAVGNLLESKGQHLAIEALTAMPGFQLAIVGEGPTAMSLQVLAQRRNVADRVRFCGRVDQGQLATYYSAADMLVLASEREGLPNVVLEAMACGTPVVASAVGGIPEAVDVPATGRLLRERSAQAIVESVQELWAQGTDRDAVCRQAARFAWGPTTRAQQCIFVRLAQTGACEAARRTRSADGHRA